MAPRAGRDRPSIERARAHAARAGRLPPSGCGILGHIPAQPGDPTGAALGRPGRRVRAPGPVVRPDGLRLVPRRRGVRGGCRRRQPGGVRHRRLAPGTRRAARGGPGPRLVEDLCFAHLAPRSVGPPRPPLLNARTGGFSIRIFRRAAGIRASGPDAGARPAREPPHFCRDFSPSWTFRHRAASAPWPRRRRAGPVARAARASGTWNPAASAIPAPSSLRTPGPGAARPRRISPGPAGRRRAWPSRRSQTGIGGSVLVFRAVGQTCSRPPPRPEPDPCGSRPAPPDPEA
jgi:hypothetical protein